MIVLRNLCKTYSLFGERKLVADNINAVFPSNTSVALLGRNGAGKSTLLRMIAGTSDPTSGEVLSTGSISFPVGFAGSFHPDMTGAQNTRFVARIYGADTDAMMAYVEEFAELGVHFQLPVRSYSSGMRSRLSFGVSMALNFDTYLIDEITAVGDAEFQRKSREVFKERMTNAGAIFVSHSLGKVRDMCKAGAVLESGKLSYYDDIEEAIERHIFNMNGPQTSANASLTGSGAGTDSETGEDLDFPEDARMLFCLGAPQTGTELVWDYLRRHRSCLFPPTREMHYFDILAGQAEETLRRRQKNLRALVSRLQPGKATENQVTLQALADVAELLAIYTPAEAGHDRHRRYIDLMLKNRNAQSVICDFTPGYITLAAENFAEMAKVGAARFMVMLRDPAERLWAQICASVAATEPSASALLQTCTKTVQTMLADGAISTLIETDYARAITALEEQVMPARIKYMFYEELTLPTAMAELCDFLSIRPRPVEPVAPAAIGPGLTPPELPAALRTELRAQLHPQYDYARQRFGDALPEAWQ
jgi:ABC-type polysaccharide/polyol phosphate transport system ATPase subunit